MGAAAPVLLATQNDRQVEGRLGQQKRSTNASVVCMGSAWLLRGSCVDPAWMLRCFCVGSAWVPRGACMDSAWNLHRLCTVCARVLHGLSTGSAWVLRVFALILHGFCMASVFVQLGFCMGIAWDLHGSTDFSLPSKALN